MRMRLAHLWSARHRALILTSCERTTMFLSYSHHNLSTFLRHVSRTPAIFSMSVS